MAAPQGATSVHYSIQLSEGTPDLEQIFDFPLHGSDQGLRDALAEVAADAMIAYLGERYPTRAVSAYRYYEGAIEGDPWPTPEGA